MDLFNNNNLAREQSKKEVYNKSNLAMNQFNNLTKEQLEELEEAKKIGKGIIEGIQQALSMPDDEKNEKVTFKQKITEWKKLAKEMKNAEKYKL